MYLYAHIHTHIVQNYKKLGDYVFSIVTETSLIVSGMLLINID